MLKILNLVKVVPEINFKIAMADEIFIIRNNLQRINREM